MTSFEELLYSKEFAIETKDPYGLALEIADKFMKFGDVIIEKNTYETDGPHRKCEVRFVIINHLDDYSKLVVECDCRGTLSSTGGILRLAARMYFRADVKETGFMTSVFDRFYVQRASLFRKTAGRDAKKITEFIEKEVLGIQALSQ